MNTQNRRQFLKQTGFAAAATLSGLHQSTASSLETPVSRKPNIIFILADDLGYGDLGCYGQQNIKTPNLDRMAAEGMKFTQHYAGSTVCAPSRCCLMTSLHTGHCRVRGNVDVLLQPEDTTIAELLKKAGYATGCIGKWGIGAPPPPEDPHRNGFDYFFGYLSMWHAHNYYPDVLFRNGKKIPLKNEVDHPENYYRPAEQELVGVATKREEYSHDLFAEDALRFIEENQKHPFFLYLPFTIPHANNEAGRKGMEVPDYGIYTDKEWPDPQKGHAAMIARMDRDIGRIMQKLNELNLDQDTLVIFTSDNGPHKEGGADPEFNDSNGSLRGIKRDLYEGGIRIPMIARWPGKIKSNSVNDHISAFWDFLPTFTELAGIEHPVEIDGLSILPAFLGDEDKQKQHEYLYWEFHEQGKKQAVRMGKWKGVKVYRQGDYMELYDLESDIGEIENIAYRHPHIVAKIEAIMKRAHSNEQEWPLYRK